MAQEEVFGTVWLQADRKDEAKLATVNLSLLRNRSSGRSVPRQDTSRNLADPRFRHIQLGHFQARASFSADQAPGQKTTTQTSAQPATDFSVGNHSSDRTIASEPDPKLS